MTLTSRWLQKVLLQVLNAKEELLLRIRDTPLRLKLQARYQRVGIRQDGVNEHVSAILRKIGAANRTEAVAIAIRKHLLKI